MQLYLIGAGIGEFWHRNNKSLFLSGRFQQTDSSRYELKNKNGLFGGQYL